MVRKENACHIDCVTHSVSITWALCDQISIWLYLMPTIDCMYICYCILSLVEGEGSGSSSEEGGEEEEEEEEKEGLEFLVSGKHLVEVSYSHLVYRLYDNILVDIHILPRELCSQPVLIHTVLPVTPRHARRRRGCPMWLRLLSSFNPRESRLLQQRYSRRELVEHMVMQLHAFPLPLSLPSPPPFPPSLPGEDQGAISSAAQVAGIPAHWAGVAGGHGREEVEWHPRG